MCIHKKQDDTHYLDYDIVRQAVAHLTVARVGYYFTFIFDCGSQDIVWDNAPATPIQLASDPVLSGRLASNVKIWFWGGPPPEANWYQGNLLTMLVDRVFYCAVTEQNDVVDKFLEALDNGHKTRQPKSEAVIGA